MDSVKQITPNELAALLPLGEDALIVDVRTDAEVAQGSIPGAVHMPVELLDTNFEQYREQIAGHATVYYLCRTGGRSTAAVQIAQSNGVQNGVNVDGGIHAWQDAGNSIAPLG